MGLTRHKCNHNIESFHDNICVTIVISDISRYTLNQEEVLQILSCMKSRKCTKGWVSIVNKKSVIIVECEYCPDLWKLLWKTLCHYNNQEKAVLPDEITHLQNMFKENIAKYIQDNTRLLGEFPTISGIHCDLAEPKKYTPYYVPISEPRIDGNLCLDNSFEEISVRI